MLRRKKNRMGSQGFSLADVLVGIGLVAVVVGGLVAGYAQTTTLNRMASLRSTLNTANVAIAEWYRRSYPTLPPETRNNITLTPQQVAEALVGVQLDLPSNVQISATASIRGISTCLNPTNGTNTGQSSLRTICSSITITSPQLFVSPPIIFGP